MPYETTWETNGVVQKFRGSVSSPELFDALKDLYNDRRLLSLRYIIRDFLDVEVFDAGLKILLEGRISSRMVHDRAPDVVAAVVTTNPEIIQSMKAASAYGLDAFPFRILPSVAEARKWIAGLHETRNASPARD